MTASSVDDTVPAALRDRLASALSPEGTGDGPGDAAAYRLAAGVAPPGDAAPGDAAPGDAAPGDAAPDGDEARAAVNEAAELLAAGESLLAGVLRADAGSRCTALDLLTADALVTHAFERAADAPSSLPALADAAMRRIALLADADAAGADAAGAGD